MSQPLVEVILPTNRSSEFLPATLESVARQTFTHWRLTVVDDGCPEPYSLARLVGRVPGARLLRQPPSGVSAARNLGIRETSGPLMVFLDDDDLWLPNRLAKQVEAWMAAPGHVGVYCAGEYIDSSGQIVGEAWSADQADAADFLRGAAPLPRIMTMMVRRDICITVGGFDVKLQCAEDLDFTLKVLQHGEMLALPERLVRYRRHNSNVSQEGSAAGRRAIRDLLVRQIAAAEAAGDHEVVDLLAEHRRGRRSIEATESVRGALASFQRRDLLGVVREIGWALRTPWLSLRAVASGTLRKLRKCTPGIARG